MSAAKETLLGVLIAAGIAPRRRLAAAILEGKVTVNGETASNLRQPVDSARDRIVIDGQPVEIEPHPAVYLMMNKPPGVLSTVRDERGRKTVTDVLPNKYRRRRLYPAGRLDKDTTGLLLMTNDGKLTHRLTHPRFALEKEYLVRIDGRLEKDDVKELERGVELDDGRTAPARVREVKDQSPFNYSLTIHEGKKRQVRRMLAHLGHRTLALKRVRIGNLLLGDLKEGQVRELSKKELKGLVGEN